MSKDDFIEFHAGGEIFKIKRNKDFLETASKVKKLLQDGYYISTSEYQLAKMFFFCGGNQRAMVAGFLNGAIQEATKGQDDLGWMFMGSPEQILEEVRKLGNFLLIKKKEIIRQVQLANIPKKPPFSVAFGLPEEAEAFLKKNRPLVLN